MSNFSENLKVALNATNSTTSSPQPVAATFMMLNDESDAQAILSSDKSNIWHEQSLYEIPVQGYETVTIEEIDESEYKWLKIFNGKTPQEIMDSVILNLINEGVI